MSQSRVALGVRAPLPVSLARVGDDIGHEDAMPKAGEVVDIGRGRVADVDYAKTGFRLQALAQCRPGAGVARDPGPGKSGNAGASIALLLVEPIPDQPQVLFAPAMKIHSTGLRLNFKRRHWRKSRRSRAFWRPVSGPPCRGKRRSLRWPGAARARRLPWRCRRAARRVPWPRRCP